MDAGGPFRRLNQGAAASHRPVLVAWGSRSLPGHARGTRHCETSATSHQRREPRSGLGQCADQVAAGHGRGSLSSASTPRPGRNSQRRPRSRTAASMRSSRPLTRVTAATKRHSGKPRSASNTSQQAPTTAAIVPTTPVPRLDLVSTAALYGLAAMLRAPQPTPVGRRGWAAAGPSGAVSGPSNGDQ